jgi:sigma-54 interacting transcriptional regulator
MGTGTRPSGDAAGDNDDCVLREIETVAPGDSAVLMYREAGTGKELIAGAVHNPNSRKSSAFLKLNCAAPNTIGRSDWQPVRSSPENRVNLYPTTDEGGSGGNARNMNAACDRLFVKNNHVVQTFSADRADQSLDVSTLPGRTGALRNKENLKPDSVHREKMIEASARLFPAAVQLCCKRFYLWDEMIKRRVRQLWQSHCRLKSGS